MWFGPQTDFCSVYESSTKNVYNAKNATFSRTSHVSWILDHVQQCRPIQIKHVNLGFDISIHVALDETFSLICTLYRGIT